MVHRLSKTFDQVNSQQDEYYKFALAQQLAVWKSGNAAPPLVSLLALPYLLFLFLRQACAFKPGYSKLLPPDIGHIDRTSTAEKRGELEAYVRSFAALDHRGGWGAHPSAGNTLRRCREARQAQEGSRVAPGPQTPQRPSVSTLTDPVHAPSLVA
jgi:hypothetical protein